MVIVRYIDNAFLCVLTVQFVCLRLYMCNFLVLPLFK